jgi:hypothetical protein
MVEGRLHHAAVSQVNRFFIGEKPPAKHFMHPLEANPFDKRVLFFHGDIDNRVRAEHRHKKLAPKKKR